MADSDSPLERLRRRLYTKGGAEALQEPVFRDGMPPPPSGWEHPTPPPQLPRKRISFATLFLICAIGFFVIAAGVAALLVIMGSRAVSPDHINLTVQGPTTIASGDTVPLLITVENKNPVPLTDTKISAVFPDGTRSADDSSATLTNYSDTLGDIAPGQSVFRTARAVYFGSENQVVTIPITIEYKTGSSNNVFQKKMNYTFTITTSPIGLSVTTLSQSASGQPITLSVLVHSNAATPVDNVVVSAEYPFGFSQTSADPTPTGTLFPLGSLKPGEERTIRISGVLTGTENDERIFRFTVGTQKNSGSGALDVSYTTKEAPILITKPFLDVSLALNHDTSDTTVVTSGQQITGILSWMNNLPSTVSDAQFTIQLSGNAINKASVSTGSGFYQSNTNTILFDKSTNGGLAALASGDTGVGSFAFAIQPDDVLRAVRNPTATLTVSIAGHRVDENNVPQTIASTVTRTIKVASDLTLSARAVHTGGPFSNSGPWPPAANKVTTYTILLSSANSVNSVGGIVATMTLPPYVTFTGHTSAGDTSITYDDSSRIVTWNIGDVAGGITKQASFQIALTPSTSQVGTSPMLVSAPTISGTDRFTQTSVGGTVSDITTAVSTDPAYTQAAGEVTQ